MTSKAYQQSLLQDNARLTTSAEVLQDAPMNQDEKRKAYIKALKPVKFIRIQKLMSKTVFEQSGLQKLTAQQLANLNAFLNLKQNRAMLAPGPKPN